MNWSVHATAISRSVPLKSGISTGDVHPAPRTLRDIIGDKPPRCCRHRRLAVGLPPNESPPCAAVPGASRFGSTSAYVIAVRQQSTPSARTGRRKYLGRCPGNVPHGDAETPYIHQRTVDAHTLANGGKAVAPAPALRYACVGATFCRPAARSTSDVRFAHVHRHVRLTKQPARRQAVLPAGSRGVITVTRHKRGTPTAVTGRSIVAPLASPWMVRVSITRPPRFARIAWYGRGALRAPGRTGILNGATTPTMSGV